MQDDLLHLSYQVSRLTAEKISVIEEVNRRTRMLALNALIEARRAGSAGAGFAVVAQEVGEISKSIGEVTTDLRRAVDAQIRELSAAGERLVSEFRGTRMIDLARGAIEIIDRNLYERSCDVRWWATDSAVVDCAAEPTEAARRYASERMATILRSYTVYLDLWVVDASGRVLSSGRPNQYPTVKGADVSQSSWFRQAMATASGDDFAVADIERNGHLGNAAVATYATAIREGGRVDGKVIGVLGIFFDWEPQASTVVTGVGLTDEERSLARVMVLDAQHRVIASSDGKGLLREAYPLRRAGQTAGYYIDGDKTIGFALTPGYETYKGLGWYGVVEIIKEKQQMRLAGAA